MEKVTALFGGPTGELVVVENVVKVLEDLLEQAKSGEISGIICAYVDEANRASYQIGGYIGAYGLLGALDMAKHEAILIDRGDR